MSLLLLLRGAGAPPVSVDGPILEAQLSAGVWTDLTTDVIAAERIRWRRGIQGSSPMDRVAATGTLEFVLRNDAWNSGATQGWYSPNHGNARAGWTFSIPCRLRYRFSNIEYPLWRGTVRTIRPTPGVARDRRVYVMAEDGMGTLAKARIRDVSAQFDQTERALMVTVLASLPDASQPVAVDLDPGLDVYPYAFDNLAGGEYGLRVMTDLTRSAVGRLYTRADGTLRYRNRNSLAIATSRLSLSDATLSAVGGDFEVASSVDNVYDRVRITVHPKTTGSSATSVLYASPSVIRVLPNATVTVWGTYTDALNTLRTVGGRDFQPLTAYTDYEGNSLETGLGSDVTGSLTVTATPFASTVKLVITNTSGAADVYLVDGSGVGQGSPRLQFRGRPIYDLAPLTVQSPVGGEEPLEHVLDVDLPYQDDVNVAQDMADYLHLQYEQLSRQVDAVTINPQRIGMATGLDLDIGDMISVTETMTGLNEATLAIQAIDGTIELTQGGAGYVWLTLSTAPVTASAVWVLDDPALSLLGDTTYLGYG